MTEEQITRLYGPRCAEHCDDCCVCEVWAMHDHIEKLEADNARLREALEWALCEIRSNTRYDNEEQFWNAYDLATDALHSGKDEK